MLFGRYRGYMVEKETQIEQLVDGVGTALTREQRDRLKSNIRGEFSGLINELDAMERDVLSTIGSRKEN